MPYSRQRIISALPESMRVAFRRANPKRLLALLLTIRAGGLLTAALGLWGFAQIADEVLEKESQAFDSAILLAFRQLHTPVLDTVMALVTVLGEPVVLLCVGLGLGIWLLMRGRREQALTLAIAAAGAGGLNYWLKELFRRSRPALWERIVDVNHYSFPSGHAMVSLVVYGTIGYLLAIHFRRWRLLIIASTILLVTAIGLSRLYLGVHWPTDVIAGYAAGIVWLIASILSLEIWQEHRRARHTRTHAPEEAPQETNIHS